MSYHDLSLNLAHALIRARVESQKGKPIPTATPDKPRFTITISREAGALGNAVAEEVGKRLNWPVYDRNLLDKIADQLDRPPSRLEEIDERQASWLAECLSGLFDKYHVGSDLYLRRLLATMRGLGEEGHCVLVGRGANFVLPPETTLRVRLVATPEDRARVIATRRGLSLPDAKAWIQKTEKERREFIQQRFHADASDPHHYDLVLNMSRIKVEEAIDLLLETLQRYEKRGALTAPTEAGAVKPPQTVLA